MFVFVSHVHHDHYRKDIFNLRKHFREIRYVLSSDIEIKAEKDIVQMQPNEKKEVMGAEIRTLRSTDEGVAFVVHYAGKGNRMKKIQRCVGLIRQKSTV